MKERDQAKFNFHFIRNSYWRGSVKKIFLKMSQNLQENTCVQASFLKKLQTLGL